MNIRMKNIHSKRKMIYRLIRHHLSVTKFLHSSHISYIYYFKKLEKAIPTCLSAQIPAENTKNTFPKMEKCLMVSLNRAQKITDSTQPFIELRS